MEMEKQPTNLAKIDCFQIPSRFSVMTNAPREVSIVFQPLLEEKDRKSGSLVQIPQQSLVVVCHLWKAVILKEPLLISFCFSVQSIASVALTDPPLFTELRFVPPNCNNVSGWKDTASNERCILPDNN
jgi:hypothetical protein